MIAPAAAGETAWQEAAPGVQLRLISTGKIAPNGRTLVGLEIDMPANTKTYWRVPGDTGLPTELDFAGTPGVSGHTVYWPFPTRDETKDYLDYVYYGPTVLPIGLELAAGTTELNLSAVLGICSDICIPAQASFTLPLIDAKPDMANGVRLKQAMALSPMQWPETSPAFGTLWYDAGHHQLNIPVLSDDVDPASLIVTTADDVGLFGTPQKSPEPNLITAPVLEKPGEIDLENQSVRLTFMTPAGAYETTAVVMAKPSE